jgi:hypothetical protein
MVRFLKSTTTFMVFETILAYELLTYGVSWSLTLAVGVFFAVLHGIWSTNNESTK